MKYLFILFIWVTFLSCQQNTFQSSDAKVATSDSVMTVDTSERDFSGLYRQGPDQNTFQDCNANEVYWVEDLTGELIDSYTEKIKMLGYPGESLHLEAIGHLAKPNTSGPGSEYSKKLVITTMGTLKNKSFKTPCYNFEFIALGNEPFWSVEIIPNEQRIVLKDVGLNKVQNFPYQPANVGGAVYRYDTKMGSEKLSVIIRQEKCSDGMSDREYEYSAEVELSGRTLKGCAIKKE